MCMLTALPKPGLLSPGIYDGISNGAWINNDGHGFAVVVGRNVVTGWAMDKERALSQFATAYADATGPAIFHSRWATHGTKDVSNCHPFRVPNMRETYIGHNGVMPSKAWPSVGDDRSDTRIFTEDIFARYYRRMDSARVVKHLEKWLGGNKVAVITADPKLRKNLYLFNSYLGEWVDGVWFSNGDHEGYGRYAKYVGALTGKPGVATYTGTKWHYAGNPECVFCAARAVDAYQVCQGCRSCQLCGMDPFECDCYDTDYVRGRETATPRKKWWEETESTNATVTAPLPASPPAALLTDGNRRDAFHAPVNAKVLPIR